MENVIPDGSCAMCVSGHDNICLNRKAIGYEFDGGFAEYVLLPQEAIEGGNVVKLSDDVSFGEGALIEPLSCCLRGQKNAGVKFNDVVVIIGAGPIGLMHIILAKAAGARKVIVSELNEFRREKAYECGADIVVNSAEEDLKQIVMNERQDYHEAAQMVMSGAVNLKPIITKVFKLEEFQEAYEAVKSGKELKVEIEP